MKHISMSVKVRSTLRNGSRSSSHFRPDPTVARKERKIRDKDGDAGGADAGASIYGRRCCQLLLGIVFCSASGFRPNSTHSGCCHTVNHVLYLNLSLFAHDSFRRQVKAHTHNIRATQTAQQLLPIDYWRDDYFSFWLSLRLLSIQLNKRP